MFVDGVAKQRVSVSSQARGFALLSIVALVIAGCGRSDLGRVSGNVTLDGTPLEEAFVEFVPTGETGSVAYGKTDANGDYRMEFARGTLGASLGENQVKIYTHDVIDVDGKEVSIPERVPVRYNDDSELVRDVQPGSNEFDFELTSEGDIAEEEEDAEAAT